MATAENHWIGPVRVPAGDLDQIVSLEKARDSAKRRCGVASNKRNGEAEWEAGFKGCAGESYVCRNLWALGLPCSIPRGDVSLGGDNKCDLASGDSTLEVKVCDRRPGPQWRGGNYLLGTPRPGDFRADFGLLLWPTAETDRERARRGDRDGGGRLYFEDFTQFDVAGFVSRAEFLAEFHRLGPAKQLRSFRPDQPPQCWARWEIFRPFHELILILSLCRSRAA